MAKQTDEQNQITDEQIKQLRADAAQVSDLVTVALCDVALASQLDEIATIDDSVRSVLERKGIVPEHVDADVLARAECERIRARFYDGGIEACQ